MNHFRKLKVAGLVFLAVAAMADAQGSNTWQRKTIEDALRKVSYVQFVLQGKYLVTPKTQKPGELPALVVNCSPQPHSLGKYIMNGRFLSGYLATGTIVDSEVVVQEGLLGTSYPVIVPVIYRVDEGKLQNENWHSSKDNSAAFFTDITLNTLLYGHYMPHKENTNEQVHKVILGLNEALAGEIQIQFDLGDVTEVAEACGVVMHKK